MNSLNDLMEITSNLLKEAWNNGRKEAQNEQKNELHIQVDTEKVRLKECNAELVGFVRQIEEDRDFWRDQCDRLDDEYLRGRWETLAEISSAWNGKWMYTRDGEIIYSRWSHKELTLDEAVAEFIKVVEGEE